MGVGAHFSKSMVNIPALDTAPFAVHMFGAILLVIHVVNFKAVYESVS